MSRSIRLLNLLQLLREYHHPATAQKLAEHLNISVRSIYRDIECLRAQGVNIEGSAGLGFVLKEDFLLPPISLNDTEVEAVFLALNWLKRIPDTELKQAAHSVLAKLNAVIPKSKQELLDATTLHSIHQWIATDEKTVEQVRLSIRHEVKIEIQYLDERGKLSVRRLWPFALGYFNDKILLAAWCELREDFRNFRLDRIQKITLFEERYPQFKRHLFQQWWQQEIQKKPITPDKN